MTTQANPPLMPAVGTHIILRREKHMNHLKPPRRDVLIALEVLQEDINRASQDVDFLRGRKANLIANNRTNPMEIALIEHDLAAAKQRLTNLRRSAENLSYLVNQDDLASFVSS